MRDRLDLLFETFVKSNRIALMWGLPFGVGVALFASDLVHFGIGDRWRPGVGLIQAFVFAILTLVFMSLATESHAQHGEPGGAAHH